MSVEEGGDVELSQRPYTGMEVAMVEEKDIDLLEDMRMVSVTRLDDTDGDDIELVRLEMNQEEEERVDTESVTPLACDEFWNKVVFLCNIETFLFVLKVVILPVQLFIMIGGPIMVLFPWPLWAFINSIIFGCVFWARDPLLDPCLSTAPQWLFGLHHELPETVQLDAEESHTENPAGVPTDSHRHCCSHVNISRERMALVLVLWSSVDIILSVMSAVGSFVFVFITFTDADGSVAEGWMAGYILLLISGGLCVISIAIRVVIMVYGIRFRGRSAERDVQSNKSSDENDSSGVIAVNRPLSLKENKIRFLFFLISCGILLTSIVFGSMTLHDFLRAQFYFPDSVGDTLHGDKASAGCDSMDPLLCLLPFPSSYYLRPSSATATGFTIDITKDMMPMLKKGARYDAVYSRFHDGFSVSSMIMWYLSPHVNSDQFVSFQNIPNSLIIHGSKTLILDSQTLDPHPHFAEKDHLDYEKDKLSYMVPAKSLHYDTTYIVIVKELTDDKGRLLPPAAAYASYLHDYQNNITDTTREEKDLARYTFFSHDILPKLIGIGINISEVQLLWDFHTASQASIIHNLAPMYNLTTSLVQSRLNGEGGGDGEKLYKKMTTRKDKCTESIYSSKMRKDYYTLNVPWYLSDTSRLLNPLDGNVVHTPLDEASKVPFSRSAKLIVQIPCSIQHGLINATALMEVGHGLFWDRSFAEMNHITEQANRHGWILWSMDWRGLTRHDLPQFLRLLLHDMSETGNSTLSAMSQGMSDKLAGYLILQHILEVDYKILLQDSDFFRAGEDEVTNMDFSTPKHWLIPPHELRYSGSTIKAPNVYLGISLGAIMGAAWNAYAPIHLRSVLIAGGSLFTFIMGRSDIFALLKAFTDLQFYSRKDLRIGMQLMQIHLDACEASGWAHSGRYQRTLQPGQNYSSDDVPNTLLQIAQGDSTVTDIAGRILAANLNASILTPTVDPVSILPPEEAPVTGSPEHVLFQVLYEADMAAVPLTSESGDSTNVHKCVIQREEITSQYSVYVNENKIIQPVCDSTTPEDPNAACVFTKAIDCGTGL